MRRFVLLCLIAAATADKLGYNYQPVGQDYAIGSGLAGGSIGSSGSGTVGGAHGGFGGLTGGNDAGNYAVGSDGSSLGGHGFNAAPITEYNKEFYTYSAPEEEFNDQSGAHKLSSSLKKSLRVVFIKTPENQGLANAALQLAKQSSEDRTAIYVLSKQADIGDLANRLQVLKGSSAHKPEVHFVKYRTPEDAARAQHAIQSQYNSLSGPSTSSNEGVAPVLNFASPASSSGGFIGGGSHGNIGGASLPAIPAAAYPAPSSSYLPPALRVK